MNIEFIKWMCDKAGWEVRIENDGYVWIVRPDCAVVSVKSITEHKEWLTYPLLLQRTIEGVNRENGDIVIQQGNFGIMVLSFSAIPGIDFKEISDQAKESALMYIYNQELDKNKEVK